MDDPLPPNPYKTLNVPKDATLATIRSAHRKLVLSCHPDKVQEESAKKVKAEQFHQVQQAYEILSDEKRRQRYDERVKLEELRAEMASDREPPLSRRAPDYDYGPPRGGRPPMPDVYERPRYETREPPRSARYSDEDYPSTKYDIRPSAKYDDYFGAPSARRSFGRAQEEKKKTRDYEEDDRERKRREREQETLRRDSRTKQRDRDERRDRETKSKSKFSPYVEQGSDSDYDDHYYNNKKRDIPLKSRYDEVPTSRRSREEPRKSSKYDPRYDDELENKLSAQREHINKSRDTVEIEPRRNGRNRATSDLRTPKKTPPPPLATVDSSKRPSIGRRQTSRAPSPVRSAKKDRRTPEIVDSPPPRKLSIPSPSTESKGIKGLFGSGRKEPQRSATYQHPADFKQPPMRRSETMPIDRMRPSPTVPLKSSNLQNMKAASDYSDSSDSDSDMSEEDIVMPPRSNKYPKASAQKPKATAYRVHEDDEATVLEPQEIFPSRPRDTSPKTRRTPDRPGLTARSSTTRAPPPVARSATYAYPKDERSPRPGLSRTESSRPTHSKSQREKLFGERSPEEEYFSPRHSSKNYPEDGYSSVRRGSGDIGRDAYPYNSPRRPQMRHNETVY